MVIQICSVQTFQQNLGLQKISASLRVLLRMQNSKTFQILLKKPKSLSKIKSRHMKPGAATGTPGSKITPTQSTSANMDQLQADGFTSSPGAG